MKTNKKIIIKTTSLNISQKELNKAKSCFRELDRMKNKKDDEEVLKQINLEQNKIINNNKLVIKETIKKDKKTNEEKEYEKFKKYVEKKDKKLITTFEEALKYKIPQKIEKFINNFNHIKEINKFNELFNKKKIIENNKELLKNEEEKEIIEINKDEYIKKNFDNETLLKIKNNISGKIILYQDEKDEKNKIITQYSTNLNSLKIDLLNTNISIMAKQLEDKYIYIPVKETNKEKFIYNDSHLYEILDISYRNDRENLYYSLYFDLETKNEDILKIYNTNEKKDDLINNFIDSFFDYLLNFLSSKIIDQIYKNFLVFKNKNQDNKLSYHIIINSITFKNLDDMKKDIIEKFIKSSQYHTFLIETRLKEFNVDIIDKSVYKKNQSFRLPFQSKIENNNILINYTTNIENKDDYYKNCFIITNKRGFYNVDEKIKLNNNNNNNNNNIYDINILKPILIEILDNLNISRCQTYETWNKILISLKSISIDIYDIFDNFSKKTKIKNQYNKNKNLKIWNNTKINNNYSIKYLLNLLKEDNEDVYEKISLKLKNTNNNNDNKDKIMNQIKEFYDFNLTKDNTNNYIDIIDLKDDDIINNQYLSKNLLNKYQDKNLIIQSPMNSGKSTIIYELIKKYHKEDKSILIITPRIKYGQFTKKNIENDLNINFDIYNDIKFKKKSLNSNYLIVQCESLSRIMKYKYDLVILDEIKSVLTRFSVDNYNCHSKYLKDSVKFESLIYNCDRYIAADGYINKFCINTLYNINKDKLNENNKMKILVNNNLNVKRDYTYFYDEEKIIEDIFTSLAKNKKIVIYSSYKTTIEEIKKIFNKYKSDKEEKLHQLFKNKTILSHHADEFKKKQNEIFDNLNEEWQKCDCLIYSGIISVGIDFNTDYYDEMYILGKNINLVNDIIQSSLRCRKLKNNLLKIYIPRYNKNNNIYDISKEIIINKINEKEEQFKNKNIECKQLNSWLKDLIIDLEYEKKLNNVYFNNIFEYFLDRSKATNIGLLRYNKYLKQEKIDKEKPLLYEDLYNKKNEYINEIQNNDLKILKDNKKYNIKELDKNIIQEDILDILPSIKNLYENNNINDKNNDINNENNDINNNIDVDMNNRILHKINDEIDEGLIGGEMLYKNKLKSMLIIENNIKNISLEQKCNLIKYLDINYLKKYYYNFKLFESYDNIIDIQKYINNKYDNYIEITKNILDKNRIIENIKNILSIKHLYIKYKKYDNIEDQNKYIKNHENLNIDENKLNDSINYIKNNLDEIIKIFDIDKYKLDEKINNNIEVFKTSKINDYNELKKKYNKKQTEIQLKHEELKLLEKKTKNKTNEKKLLEIKTIIINKKKELNDINMIIKQSKDYDFNNIKDEDKEKILNNINLGILKKIINYLFDSRLEILEKKDINKNIIKKIIIKSNFDYLDIEKYNENNIDKDVIFTD